VLIQETNTRVVDEFSGTRRTNNVHNRRSEDEPTLADMAGRGLLNRLGARSLGPRKGPASLQFPRDLHVLRPAEDAELVAPKIEHRRERVRRLAQARIFGMKGYDRDRNLRPGEGGLRRNRWPQR
jgi:hypothetical protein